MKKTLAIFAILLMAFSSLAFAEGEEAAPAPEAPSEPAPSETPSEPASEPAEPSETSTESPIGEQPLMPPLEGGSGDVGTGGEGGSTPAGDQNRQPQNGPGNGGCWVGEQQVPCPGEGQQNEGRQPQQQPGTNFMNPQNIPPGCKQENNNGMINIVCDNAQRQAPTFDCTPGPQREEIEKKCKETGGRIVVKNIVQSKGCGIVDCVFGGASEGNFMPGQQQTCPGPDELAKQEENCKSMGLNPKRLRSNCEFVQCEDPNKQQTMCPDVSLERMNAKEQCSANGGKMIDEFDAYGCPAPKCISSGESCSNGIPQEAYFKCEDQGGKLVVNTDESGCITFTKCVARGQEGVQAEDTLDEVPPAAKLLQVALKLESIKISFDRMAKQITAIADYYDNEGDSANAERFRTAAGMFESAKKQIDGVKEELKLGVNGMSVEQIIDIKHKIRQISDVVMEDALYVILGGEATGTAQAPIAEETTSGELPNFMPAATNDCGSNGECFAKALRICFASAAFTPDRNINIKIAGLKEEACVLEGRANTPEGEKSLTCKFVDYATQQLNTENFMQYCEGSFVDYVKTSLGGKMPESTQNQQQFTNEQAFQGQMMGCEKVDKGINKQGVCGNECCEARFGESSYNCPQDCMASQQIVKQPIAQRVMQGVKQEMGGCADEMSGKSPKDVCGNDCCEPGESPQNCPKDCNPMQRPPMGDEGQFFNQQNGPMQPNGQQGQISNTQTQGVQEMPREQWLPPQQPVNPPEGYIESTPTQGEAPMPLADGCTRYPDGSVSCGIPPPTNEGGSGGGGSNPVITETTSSGTETSGGGGGSVVTGAVVAFDLLKEFLGR